MVQNVACLMRTLETVEQMNAVIIETQARLYAAARRNQAETFHRLLRLISQPGCVAASVEIVLRSEGGKTAGLDFKTRADYRTADEKAEFMEQVSDFLTGHYYLPHDMRLYHVAKRKRKGDRKILIPILRDRVIGHLLKLPLEPIWEGTFLSCSRGYRPKHGRMDNIFDCQSSIGIDRPWVLLADVADCFFSINPDRLICSIQRRIADKHVLEMIRAFLEVRACDRGFNIEIIPGVPAGFPLAPLLMNIYLHQVDVWSQAHFHPHDSRAAKGRRHQRLDAFMSRFADNIVFMTKSEQDAMEVRDQLDDFLEAKLGLALSQTDVVHAADGFEFLGYHLQLVTDHQGRGRLRVRLTDERMQSFKRKAHQALRNEDDIKMVISDLNQALSGLRAEARVVTSRGQLRSLDQWARRRFAERLSGRDIQPALSEGELVELGTASREGYWPFSGNPYI